MGHGRDYTSHLTGADTYLLNTCDQLGFIDFGGMKV